MSRVLKHPLPNRVNQVRLPVGTKFLAFASVVESGGERDYMWTDEPTDSRVGTTAWTIWVLMTGEHVPPEAKRHLATHVGRDGTGHSYVVHYYGTEAT